MGIKSMLRSTMIRTGLEVGVPVAEDGLWLEPENRLSFELRMWSRSLRSNFAEINSAAAPFGHRIIGIAPDSEIEHLAVHVIGRHSPIVTTTLKRPLTVLSTIASSSSSLICALFICQYVSLPMPRLNKSGSPTMKFRYWSKTWAIHSDVLEVAICVAKSSKRGRGMDERKLM